jgi:hydroxyacylglutathione hydrolase
MTTLGKSSIFLAQKSEVPAASAPYNRGMLRETFPVGPLQCNCTILGDETTREAVVVDPGDNIPEILARLAKHKFILKQILITHAHIDHVGGAVKLKKATGAPIVLNERDVSLLRMMDLQAGWLGVPTPEVAEPDLSADDGLRVGLASAPAEVLCTPGHTPGSISLYMPAEKLLLAGDTLFAGSIGRTDLPGGDSRQILRSLRDRLLVLPDSTRVIPGHGPETTIGAERASNPFLQPGVRL